MHKVTQGSRVLSFGGSAISAVVSKVTVDEEWHVGDLTHASEWE